MSVEVIKYIKEQHTKLLSIYNDARDNVEIPEDEYFESDAYYEGSINTLEDILNKFGVNV